VAFDAVQREWAAALDAVGDPIFLHDAQSRILRCNKAFQKLTGVPFEQLIRRTYQDFLPKPDTATSECPCGRQDRQDVPCECEITVDKTIYRSRAFPVVNEKGEFVYSAHILEDVTESRAIASQLNVHQRLTQDVIDNSPTLIYALDPDGKFILANKLLATLLGVEIDQILGNGRESFLPQAVARQHRQNDLLVMDEKGTVELEEVNEEKDGKHVYLSRKYPLIGPKGNVYGVCGISTDITARKSAEQALTRANRALLTLRQSNRLLVRSSSESELLKGFCDAAVTAGNYRAACVGYLESNAEQSLRFLTQTGFTEGQWESFRRGRAAAENRQSPTLRAIRDGHIVICQDIFFDPLMFPWRAEAQQIGYAAKAAFPLMLLGKPFGVFAIFAVEPDSFDANEMELLTELAEDLSFGIGGVRSKEENRKYEVRLKDNMVAAVQAIAGIVEMRDPYTAGHQSRVAELARTLASKLDIPEDEVFAIYLAGLVHDLGKIKIPSEILSKPSRLTDIERLLINVHPQAGFDILRCIDFSWPIAELVLAHHERMDGSGYPNGLSGEAILFGARVLAVADVVEAISSHRPYRPAMGIGVALEEIERHRGKLYDVKVVDACLDLFRNDGYALGR